MNAISGVNLEALNAELEYRRRALTVSGRRRQRRARRSVR